MNYSKELVGKAYEKYGKERKQEAVKFLKEAGVAKHNIYRYWNLLVNNMTLERKTGS